MTAPAWIDLSGYLPASGTATDIECHPTDENIVYMTLNNNVYKSTDKGLSWTDISGTLPNIHISSIAYYKNALEGLYIATDAGVYYKDCLTFRLDSFQPGSACKRQGNRGRDLL